VAARGSFLRESCLPLQCIPYPGQVTCVPKNSATMVEGGCHAYKHAVKIPSAWGRRTITLFGYPSANERVYDRCLLYTMRRVRLHW